MWRKLLFIIFLFYLFALLQNSFFKYFNLFGAIPNLVLVFFFLLIFFSQQKRNLAFTGENIFYAIIAGILLDIFSYTYIGPSIILLIVLGFLLKKSQSMLKNRDDNYPIVYFYPLLILFLLAYNLLMGLYLYFSGLNISIINFNFGTILTIIYNLIVASVFFYSYKLIANGKKIQNKKFRI
jgi:rod shape-determining protein MreD